MKLKYKNILKGIWGNPAPYDYLQVGSQDGIQQVEIGDFRPIILKQRVKHKSIFMLNKSIIVE